MHAYRTKIQSRFLENKASNEKFLFYIFDFFFRVESSPLRLYHQLPTTLYKKFSKSIFSESKLRTQKFPRILFPLFLRVASLVLYFLTRLARQAIKFPITI